MKLKNKHLNSRLSTFLSVSNISLGFALLCGSQTASAQSDFQSSAQTAARSFSLSNPLVMTYFFPWYDATMAIPRDQIDRVKDGAPYDYLTVHPRECLGFDAAPNNATYQWYIKRKPAKFATTKSTPTSILFSYKDEAWFYQEMRRIADNRIDASLVIFRQDSSDLIPTNLNRALQRLDRDGKPYPQIGLYNDVAILPEGDLTAADNYANMIIRFYRSIDPKYWFRINSKVVVGIYGERYLGNNLTASINRIRSKVNSALGVDLFFYGSKKHAMRGIPISLYHQWGAAAQNNCVTTVPGVDHYATSIAPGYDFLGKNGVPRRVGQTYNTNKYSSAWRYAIGNANKIVAIETWNEYIESTSIAPTKEYGTLYTDATSAFIQQFKQTH